MEVTRQDERPLRASSPPTESLHDMASGSPQGSARSRRRWAMSALRRATVVSTCLLAGGQAYADDDEASVHLDVAPALLSIEDPQERDARDVVPAFRLGLRATWGVSDTYAVEVQGAFLAGRGAEFADQVLPSGSVGTIVQDMNAVRVTAGATARLGVRWIPTITAHAGFQYRLLPDGFAISDNGLRLGQVPGGSRADLVVLFGAGIDYRFDAHWIAGISVQLVHGFPLDANGYDSIEIPVHLSYYWYPRL